MADAGHDDFHEVIMVDAHDCVAPLPGKSALDVKKFVMSSTSGALLLPGCA